MILAVLVILVLVVFSLKQYSVIKNLKQQHVSILEDFDVERKVIRKDAKKRSTAITWGKTIENFVPFMKDFPVPTEDCNFLGMPIDLIAYTDRTDNSKCAVHFIEVKSGSSGLTREQKNIKDAIESNRVYFHEVRVESNTEK